MLNLTKPPAPIQSDRKDQREGEAGGQEEERTDEERGTGS
jgi:hypothetical protein